MELVKVLGFTTNNRNSSISQPGSGNIIYVAGCVVVMLDPKSGRQQYLVAESKQTITTLAISDDGHYLATADCGGHEVSIRIWNLINLSSSSSSFEQQQQQQPTIEASFSGHNSEVSCMAFSPDKELLVSVGSQHDLTLNIWDWRKNLKLAQHKLNTKVRSVAFAADSSYFVTVGESHVKYWYVKLLSVGQQEVVRSIRDAGSILISCKAATLGNYKDASFCDVRCGRGETNLGKTFCITKQGFLCELNEKRLLHKWVDLRTSSANCLAVGEQLIAIGCANGVVRCFSTSELRFLRNLPRPHPLGTDIANKKQINHHHQSGAANYPSLISIGLDEVTNTIGCTYNDRSIYVWASETMEAPGANKLYSALYHSSCIWGVDVYPTTSTSTSPTNHKQSNGNGASSNNPATAAAMLLLLMRRRRRRPLAEGSFVTCSSDDTLRIWNCYPKTTTTTPSATATTDSNSESISRSGGGDGDDDASIYKENVFSQDAVKIIFTDPGHKFLRDLDCIGDNEQLGGGSGGEKQVTNYDSNEGLRCLKLSPDGKHFAVGSRSGTIRVFDLARDCSELKSIAAHDAEVLCLEYSDPQKFDGYYYLASSSRDKLIHLFDAANGYKFLQTIDDHSSSITALRFVNNRTDDCLQLISCGTDQKIVFRKGKPIGGGGGGATEKQLNFVSQRIIEGKTTFYDMEVDCESSCLMTACQDRMIRLFNVAQVKYQSGFKGSSSNEGTIIRLALDPSCTFLAASCTDKSVSIYDYQRGEKVATISHGLSDLITDMKFTLDGRYLIACSGNGCIYIWTSPAEVANASSYLVVDQHLGSRPLIGQHHDWNKRDSYGYSTQNAGYQVQRTDLNSDNYDEDDQRTLRDEPTTIRGEFQFEDNDDDDGQSSQRYARSQRSTLSNRKSSRDPSGGLVSNMAKYFQSRENLDKISSRQRYIHDSLFNSGTARRTAAKGSLSGQFAGQTPDQAYSEETRANARAKSLSRLSSPRTAPGSSRRRANSSGDEVSSADEDESTSGRLLVQKSATLNSSRQTRCDNSLAPRTKPTSGHYGTLGSSRENRSARRKPLDSNPSHNQVVKIRSSRSECNLKLNNPAQRFLATADNDENNSFECLNYQTDKMAEHFYCQKLDLTKLDPNRVHITRELCQHLVEELRLVSKFATRLHQRLHSGGSKNLANFMSRGIHNSLDILSIVPPRALVQHQFRSQVNLSNRSTNIYTQSGPSEMDTAERAPVATRRSSVGSSMAATGLKQQQQQQRPIGGRRNGNSLADHHQSVATVAQVEDNYSSPTTTTTSAQAKVSEDQQEAKQQSNSGSRLNIDQVLEAYSDRLFKMVQQRMEYSGNTSNNATSLPGRELANSKQPDSR